MSVLPWIVGTVGAMCLAFVFGAVAGVWYGARLEAARQEARRPAEQETLSPKYWGDEEVARKLALDQPTRGVPRIAGLED